MVIFLRKKSFEMKVWKVLLGATTVLAVVYLVLCFAGPKEMKVSVERVIPAPALRIRAAVTDFAAWEDWSPWQADSTMVMTLTGAAHQPGHRMAWTGEQMGAGSQTIAYNACDSVEMTLDFGMGEPTPSRWFFTEAGAEGTRVTWTFDGGNIGFWSRGLMAVLDPVGMISKDYVNGLEALERVVVAPLGAGQSIGAGTDPCAPVPAAADSTGSADANV